jgi:hypothetical protein
MQRSEKDANNKENKLAVLPRGGLGDFLYHALFARYIESRLSGIEPVVLAPRYAAFLAELLGVRHVPVCSVLTDVSAGLHIRGEFAFWKAFHELRGGYLASFTNDVVDHGLARVFRLSLLDNGTLGNWFSPFQQKSGMFSREGLNRLLHYRQDIQPNPAHIVNRQRRCLAHLGLGQNLPEAYREIWLEACATLSPPEQSGRTLLLLFPETAQLARNLTFAQVEHLVRQLRSYYQIRIFTRSPDRYRALDVETAEFSDRLEPIRQINGAAAVISADTLSAHLAGISGVPTYVVCNFAHRPVWCRYWGSPYSNVFNFEAGSCFQLDDDFEAFRASEDTLLFESVLAASRHTDSAEPELSGVSVLTGSAARSQTG